MNFRQREQYKRLLRIIFIAIIVMLECYVFSIFWNRYYATHLWIEPFWNKGNKVIILLYGFFLLLFMYIYGGMKIGYMKSSNIIYSQALAAVFTNALMYLQIALLWRHIPYVLPMIAMTLLDFAIAGIGSFVFDKIFVHTFPARKLLLIYDEYSMDFLIHKMEKRPDKYKIIKRIQAKVGEEELIRNIDAFGREGVILGDLHAELRNDLLKYCYARGIRVYMTPKLSDILVRSSEALHVFDTPLLLERSMELTIGQRFWKRLLDVIASFVFIVLTSPFMIVIAILIKAYDGGPVFFRQKRLTIHGKEFEVLKFRSMVVDAEKDGIARLASENDSRITPVGRIIRAIRMDELPQLFNILKGDMSLVGPRPERPEIAKEYEKSIPEFSYRLKVKAGLTGYAQVYGKYNTTAYDKLKLDLMYIENYSIWLDLKLILGTVKILFIKESTEGLESGEIISLKEEDPDDQNGDRKKL